MKTIVLPRPFAGAGLDDKPLDEVVADLRLPHRARAAVWHLVGAGPGATEAVLRGLEHPDPTVRAGCAEVFDHAWREDARAPLCALLDDADENVRWQAVHALTCDRCKKQAARRS